MYPPPHMTHVSSSSFICICRQIVGMCTHTCTHAQTQKQHTHVYVTKYLQHTHVHLDTFFYSKCVQRLHVHTRK